MKIKTDSTKYILLRIMRHAFDPSAREISDILKLPYSEVLSALMELEEAGLVRRMGKPSLHKFQVTEVGDIERSQWGSL